MGTGIGFEPINDNMFPTTRSVDTRTVSEDLKHNSVSTWSVDDNDAGGGGAAPAGPPASSAVDSADG